MRNFMLAAAVAAAFAALAGCNSQTASAPKEANVSDESSNIWVDAMNVSDDGTNPPGPSPDDVIFCPDIRDNTTRADCERIGLIRANLAVGGSGVQYPPEITRGDTVTVSFAVTNDPGTTSPGDILGGKPNQEAPLKVGRRMAAQLSGEGFKIDPEGLQQKDLYAAQGAEWDWKVTALKAPRHRLKITAYVVIPDKDGALKENLLKTLDLPLTVKVTTGQRIGDWMDASVDWMTRGTNWLKVLGAFILAALSVWGIVRRKKAPPAPPAPPANEDEPKKGGEEPNKVDF